MKKPTKTTKFEILGKSEMGGGAETEGYAPTLWGTFGSFEEAYGFAQSNMKVTKFKVVPVKG